MATAPPPSKVSTALASFRWLFMPLGLLALVAIGIHAAADLVDDALLKAVEQVDGFFDMLWTSTQTTSGWAARIGEHERTLIARALTLVWELAADFFVALPLLGYAEEENRAAHRYSLMPVKTWRSLFTRVNERPRPMRIVRPAVTAVFALAGAVAISRLVEGTLVVGLTGDVAPAGVAAALARVFGTAAIALVLWSLGWRAVLRSLEHADEACEELEKRSKSSWLVGLWGNALALPLAFAVILDARSFLAVFL